MPEVKAWVAAGLMVERAGDVVAIKTTGVAPAIVVAMTSKIAGELSVCLAEAAADPRGCRHQAGGSGIVAS